MIIAIWTTKEMGVFYWNLNRQGYGKTDTLPDNTSGDPDLIETQAGAFKDCCNIWAPRYSQVGMLGLARHSSSPAFNDYLGTAVADVISAFRSFLQERPDKKRPFVLAGHSQGSIILVKVIKECIEGQADVEAQFVAAYLAGSYVPQDVFGTIFKSIHPCTGPLDTKCIISWDTRTSDLFELNSVHSMGPGLGLWPHLLYWGLFNEYCNKPEDKDDVSKGRLQISPVTWTTEGEGKYLGAKQYGKTEPVMPPEEWSKSIKVTDKAVWVEDPRSWLENAGPAASGGNLHPIDVHLWFFNIKENVEKRVASFKA